MEDEVDVEVVEEEEVCDKAPDLIVMEHGIEVQIEGEWIDEVEMNGESSDNAARGEGSGHRRERSNPILERRCHLRYLEGR